MLCTSKVCSLCMFMSVGLLVFELKNENTFTLSNLKHWLNPGRRAQSPIPKTIGPVRPIPLGAFALFSDELNSTTGLLASVCCVFPQWSVDPNRRISQLVPKFRIGSLAAFSPWVQTAQASPLAVKSRGCFVPIPHPALPGSRGAFHADWGLQGDQFQRDVVSPRLG